MATTQADVVRIQPVLNAPMIFRLLTNCTRGITAKGNCRLKITCDNILAQYMEEIYKS